MKKKHLTFMENARMPDNNVINFDELQPLPYKNSCITIGNFDGVHLGHQAIIKQMVHEGRKRNHPVLVVTFYPNPIVFFKNIDEPFYLSSPVEKEEFICSLGVDKVITIKFDHKLANLSPEAFLTGLKTNLNLNVLIAGEDFTIGKDRKGTISVIEEIGKEQAFLVKVITQVSSDGDRVSSTMVREALDKGEVLRVTELLGRPYRMSGVIVHGADRGSKIGVPTANLSYWEKKKIPGVGVYATWVHLNNKILYGLTNIGYRPTFEDQSNIDVETLILDFDGNIYGEKMSLDFIHKLRDEQKFANLEAFLDQIERDKINAKRIFQDVET